MTQPVAEQAVQNDLDDLSIKAEVMDLARVTPAFRPQSERARNDIEDALRVSAQWALENTRLVSDDAVKTLQALVSEIDRTLTEQIDLILHHESFQKLESAWRGLHYLVSNTETDEMLQLRVMNISKRELHRTLKWYKGTAWDQSPIFKRLYEEEYGTLGGKPYGCVVGDYYFDHSAPDVELLSELSKISAAAHAPFISAVAPSLFLMDSWQELSNPRDLSTLFTTADHAAWRSLRETEEARYIGLTLPRFLARLPYGANSDPVDEFDFEESTAGGDSKSFCWANAAYAMAVNINRSFKEHGWCSRIRGVESGGGVEGLPAHTFPTDDGGVDLKCPTEIAISDRREAELAKNGFMPLLHKKNTDLAVFVGAQSLQKSPKYDDPDATANANLAARLPYLFATCRFAHYLKAIVRDKVGSFGGREEMESWLQNWIIQYVHGDPVHASEREKSQKPLAAAQIVVEDIEGNPGYYRAKFYLKPHYQLEGLTVSLRLVSRLPNQTA
jgi:type VI secretion system protein ImpC